MASENRVYQLPEDEEELKQLIYERDILAASWVKLEKENPQIDKAYDARWYRLFSVNFLVSHGQMTTEELHESMMQETADGLNEYYFWKYLSVIAPYEHPELSTTTP